MREAREALAELADAGRIPTLADDVAAELESARARAESGELLEQPSEAELAVLRLLATDLSIRQIGEELFLSPNTIRTHIRALYRKLGSNTRPDAVARATALGLLDQEDHQGDRPHGGVRACRPCQAGDMPTREYRVVVAGELSGGMGVVFEGMTLTHEEGNTVLYGPVADQTELLGLLQHVSALGLTLLEATAVEAERSAEVGAARERAR